MRLLGLTLCAITLLAQVRKVQPVGLVMGTGASVARGAMPAAPVKPGEVLFSGDTLKSGGSPASFLFCPQKYSAALGAGGEAVLTETSVEVRTGALANRKPIASCFLPEVQKLSIASQQHYGVMMSRAGSVPPPKTTFAQRLDALDPETRQALDSTLAGAAEDAPESHVSRAAALERAGLFYDAGEAYRKAADVWPEAAWLKRKIVEIENTLLKEQARE